MGEVVEMGMVIVCVLFEHCLFSFGSISRVSSQTVGQITKDEADIIYILLGMVIQPKVGRGWVWPDVPVYGVRLTAIWKNKANIQREAKAVFIIQFSYNSKSQIDYFIS